MSDSRIPFRPARIGIRLIAAVLAMVMVVQLVPAAAFARSKFNIQDLAQLLTLALSDLPESDEDLPEGDEPPSLPEEGDTSGGELPPEGDDMAGSDLPPDGEPGVPGDNSVTPGDGPPQPDEGSLPPEDIPPPAETGGAGGGTEDPSEPGAPQEPPQTPDERGDKQEPPLPMAAGIIVKMKETRGMMSAQSIEGDGLEIVDASGSLHLVEVSEEKSLAEALDELRGMDSVEYAEPNYILRAQGSFDFLYPDDPEYESQWGLHRIQDIEAWGKGLEFLFLEAAKQGDNPYDVNVNGILDEEDDIEGLYGTAGNVIVAVLDTGVDAGHEDLSGRVLDGYNFISKNYVTADDSFNGHGTHVTGIIAAATNNHTGIAGTAGEFPVSILPAKVLDSAGLGTMYDVATAIRWAVDQGARVINLSLGARLFDYPLTLADAVAYAQEQGALVIAAAGNEGKHVDGFYPACLPGVLAVGASDDRNVRTSFSNYMESYEGVFMLAPGESIRSTVPQGYGNLSGTSQACAFVSGTAALIRSVFPGIKPGQVVLALKEGEVGSVLSAKGAIQAASSHDHDPGDLTFIEFVSPNPGDYGFFRVSGEVDLTVKVLEPSLVKEVVFYADFEEIGVVQQAAFSQGGYVTLKWDTTQWEDDCYWIEAYAHDFNGKPLGNDSISLEVANNQVTGLIMNVVNPDGHPAAEALVTVHHIYRTPSGEEGTEGELVCQEAWTGKTDPSGRVMLPAGVLPGGNQYLVTARGTNPAFFYWDIVWAPDLDVTLTAEGASTLNVAAYRRDGSPLAGADVSIELPALPGITLPGEVLGFSERDLDTNFTPLVKLNALGQSSITVYPGSYNVRVSDHSSRYYLASYDVLVDDEVATVTLGSDPNETSVFSLVFDAEYKSAVWNLKRLDDPLFPNISVARESEEPVTIESVTVTSGTYGGTAVALTSGEYWDEWEYVFQLAPVVGTGGDEHTIHVGSSLTAKVEPAEPGQEYYSGAEIRLAVMYQDEFGNRLISAGYGPYYSRQRVLPRLLAYDDHEEYEGVVDDWQFGSIRLPEGIYDVFTRLEDSHLGDIESDELTIEVKPTPSHAFSTTFIDEHGEPLYYCTVYMGVYAGGSYYFDPRVSETTGQDGKIVWDIYIEDGLISPGDRIALVVLDIWGNYALFLTRTLTVPALEDPDRAVTFEIGTLYEVEVEALNRDGEALTNPLFSVYQYVDDESAAGGPGSIPVGFPLHGINPRDLIIWGPLTLFLEEGDYLIQAAQRDAYSESDGLTYYRYYLSERISVPNDLPPEDEDGNREPVTLDAEDAVAFTVVVPESCSDGYTAFALYPPGISQVPVFGEVWSDHVLCVSPGEYHLEGVLSRKTYTSDGLWSYWLTKDEYVLLDNGILEDGVYTWTLGNAFDDEYTTFALVPPEDPEKTGYEPEDTVKATVRIEDGQGNRLVGMALNFDYLGSGVGWSSLTAVRVPGGGQLWVSTSDSPEEGVGAMTHEEIAPFITVLGPDGDEVYRHKNAGANYGFLEKWDSSFHFYTEANRLTEDSTFFSAEYVVPKNAIGGEYQMVMELEAGPEGSFSRTLPFTVLAVHAPPTLDALPPYTNADSVTVTGVTKPGADVTLYSSLDGGESTVAGTATADEEGQFSVTVDLPDEGCYEFTATSTVGDETSAHSAPVSVTVDRQPPGQVVDLQAEVLDASHVRLTWSPPIQADPSGIAFYRVRRLTGDPPEEVLFDNITPGEPVEEVAWLDSGLTARTEYTYEVWAVDGAGNEGIPAEVKATTTAGQDPVPPTPPRNLSVFLSGFSVTLTWEPATDNIGVAGYKVYRWVKEEGPSAAVVTVIEDPDAVSFSEPDILDASTTYVYLVVAYDVAGNESIREGTDPEGIPAAVAEITTRALMITTFQWSAPRVECGLLDPGNPLDDERPAVSVTVVGDASRTAKATVVFAGVYVNLLDEDPDNDGIYEVDLVEDTSDEGLGLGIYRGSIPIPRGTTRLLSITFRLSDSRGHSVEAKARGVPEEFAGIVEVEVSSDYPDADALKDAEIKLWSESLGTGMKVTVNGTGTYFLSGLPPATDYELTLKSQKNEMLAEWPDISVGSGLTSRVVVDAAIPATFDIYVVEKDGQPAVGVTVTVTRENGELLAQGMTSGQTGLASLRYSAKTPLAAGTPIVVSLALPSYLATEYTGIAGKRIVLGPGTNSITIELPTRGRASLYGTVKSAQTQTPLTEARIAAYQVIVGRETLIKWTRTGSSGDYSLNLYEGPVRLVITHSTLGISEEIRLDNPLEPGENRECDLSIQVPKAISLIVNTKRIGEPTFTMDLDWRVTVSLKTTIINWGTEDNPKKVSASASGIEDGFVKIPQAEPGDRVEITVDGYQANMTKDTVWVTLDEDCWALAEVNLVEMGTLKARMLDSAGNLLSGTKRYAELFEIRGQRTRFLETLTSTNGTIQTKPLDPGTPDDPVKYALVFHWAPLPSVINVNGVWMSPFEDLEHLKTYLGDEGVAVEDLVFVDEPVIDLGTVRLPLPASLQSGYWRGVEGNDIVANKYEAAPGSVITLRGSYHTEAGKMPYRPRLYFGMPSGATLVPGSVVLTVTEGIAPHVSTRPDAVELSFGNGVKEAVSGTVVYRVKLPDDPDTAVCEVRMWGNYQSNKNEEITTITIYVPYVSIEAPSLVWNTDRTVEVSGKATPKATVRVYDMNYFLAETRSSDLGTWRTTVVLPDRGPQANHYLRAEVAIVETDEATSPSWPTGAALTASKVESKAVTLSWPEAQDEVEIAQYVVTGYLSDGSVGVVRTAFPTGTGSIVFRVDDLVPETTYSFKVEALNASYNWSSVPLTLDVTTGPEDTVPPSWTSGAHLTASEVKFTSLVLNWPEATDYEGLKEYRVSCTPNVGSLRNPVTVPAGTETLLVTGLQRGVEYLFQVEAIDINGNVATLSRAISTLQNDTEPPVWPEGAKLTAIVLDTEVTLDWPLALDNVEVRSYYVYQRTETGWQYKGNTIKTIKYLSPETTYTFKVEAADSSGNLVQNPLEITVTTPPRDVTPPRWEAGAAVTIVTQTWTYCEIDFPSAYDESGIDHYFWYDHQRQGYYTGSATYFGGLEPGKEYTFTILAQDRRGNQTPLEAGLQFTVKAEPGGPEPTWPPGSTVEIVELNPTHVRLKWTKAFAEDFSDGVASYSLTATKDGTVVCGDTVGLSIDTWILGPLVPGETYTFAVEALSRTGKASTNGPKVTATTPLTDTQPPKWPDGAGLSAWSMSKDRDGTYTVHFAWPQAIEFEKRHYVLEAVDSQGRHAPSSPTIVTQEFGWHLWGLSPAEAYDVTVTAVDLSGNVSVPLTTKVFTPGWMSGASVMSLSGSQGASMSAQDTADNQRVVSSTPIKVKYDKDAVVIKKVTMQQSDGRKVEFEPVGRFVYVWAPSYSFNFDVEFNKPERVTELRIISEAGTVLGGPLETPAQPDTVIATTGPLKASGSRAPGKLYASYMVTPSRTSLIDLPPYDAEVERSSLPSLWTRSTFDEGGVTVTYDDEEENSGTAHVRAFVGGDPRMEVNIRYEFTQAQPGTSTEPSFSYSIDPTSAEFKFTLEVALDPAVIRAHMGAGAQEMGMQAWYHTPAPLVRVFGDTAVHGGLNIETLIDTVSGAHEVQDYEMDLDDLLLGLNPDCPAHHVEYSEALIQMEKDRARTRKVAESVVSIGSIALGVVFPGIGFAVGSWLVSKAFSMYNDIEQDRNFQEIKNEIQADELCRPETPEFKKDLIADPTWIIDPSGYVYEVTPDNRLEGVTATAYQYVQGFGGGSWLPWDATWFEQDNPVLTDGEGRYGWDVPEGEWKVYFEKEGYLPAESWEMTVPPPHTDVNIAMVTTEAPEVSSVTADAALGVDIVFSKYMRTSTVTPGTVTVTELEADGTVRMDDAGAPVMVRGVVEPLDAVADPSDAATQLARHFRFVPDFPLVLGEKYLIRINKVVESYTGLSLAADWVGDRTAVLVIPVTGVSLSRKSVTLEVGESTTLAVTIIPENATNQGVSWSSSNTAVATVTQNGTVRGISAGTAIITVTTDDGGYQDTCTVTVKERPSGYDPGDGGEPSGPKPPKEAPADEVLAEETYVLGPGQTTLSVMGGILVLEIPAGAFPAGTKLIIRRLKAEASPTDPTLSVVASPTYEILVQGQGPAKPVTVRFMYCNLCLKGMDPRKLGVYRQSPSDPGTFTYVGGVVDTANHTVTVMLSGFSRCVVLGRNVTFGDIANHWARNEIEVLASRYIVSGVSSTEFQPDRLITRAELAKLLIGTLALDPNTVMPGSAPSTPSFTDVSPDSWYYSVVEMASATGLIKGDAGLFRPNDPVTRQEMAVMLGRALGAGYTVPADAKQSLPFSDASDIAPWASDGVAAAWYWGLMQGMGDNEFQPHGNATRAQAAAVVLRMLELKGLVSGMVTLTGTLSVSEIGGRHFELACDDGKVYVLLAQTAQARNCLEEAAPAASSGSVQVTVTGFLSDAPNVYMRGQLVKAIRVER